MNKPSVKRATLTIEFTDPAAPEAATELNSSDILSICEALQHYADDLGDIAEAMVGRSEADWAMTHAETAYDLLLQLERLSGQTARRYHLRVRYRRDRNNPPVKS